MSDPTGAELIAAERQRQINAEGYTAEHDDGHPQEMAAAAACYLDVALRVMRWPSANTWDRYLTDWPWEPEAWKPDVDPIRDLAKAGALIAAELDRLLRAEAGAS